MEPFAGSGAVYFALLNEGIPEQIKARGRHFRAVLNDADKEIMSLYRTVRDYPEILAYSIYFTPYSRAEHKRKYLVDGWQSFTKNQGDSWGVDRHTVPNPGNGGDASPHLNWQTLPQRILTAAPHLGTPETLDPYACLNAAGRAFVEPDVDIRVEWARRYLVENFQGHVHGNEWGVTRSFSISGAGNERTPNTTMRTPEGWHHLPQRILAASPHLQQDLDALKKVYLECDDAIKCIERWATPETLFYVDAPYLSKENYYRHNADQGKDYNLDLHYRLAECLNRVECAGAIASYYPDELFDELYPEEYWERHYKETVASSAGITRQSKSKKRPKRVEMLLIRKQKNPDKKIINMSGQMSLF